MSRNCIACGMKLDHSIGQSGRLDYLDYCSYCTRLDGTMCSFEENLDRMSSLFAHQKGISKEEARTVVGDMMNSLPAWKDGKK